MENFRRQFTLEAVAALDNLAKDLRGAEEFSDVKKRDAFRTLHTIKGTAQTFDFAASSSLAHELESLLSAGKTTDNLFLKGIGLLIKSLSEKDFVIPTQFTKQMRVAFPNATETSGDSDSFSSEIPEEIFSQLSNREKDGVRLAIRDGKNLYGLEIGFEATNFSDELINFRESLLTSNEIVATFPSAKFNGDGKIGFQIIVAGTQEIETLAEKNKAEIVWSFSPANFPDDLRDVLSQVVRHGETIAKKFNKRIEIKTETDETTLSPQKLKLVFDILLHLVRNAVDHAIERDGKIEINLRRDKNGLRLMVSDDGRGIDLEKLRAQAIKKNLISSDVLLTERETVDLIFSSEFSTAAKITEMSGRGIGLDAVKNSVENANGKITVETQTGKGTTFEIFLPNEK